MHANSRPPWIQVPRLLQVLVSHRGVVRLRLTKDAGPSLFKTNKPPIGVYLLQEFLINKRNFPLAPPISDQDLGKSLRNSLSKYAPLHRTSLPFVVQYPKQNTVFSIAITKLTRRSPFCMTWNPGRSGGTATDDVERDLALYLTNSARISTGHNIQSHSASRMGVQFRIISIGQLPKSSLAPWANSRLLERHFLDNSPPSGKDYFEPRVLWENISS